MFGKARQRATQATPPCVASGFGALKVEKSQVEPPKRPNETPKWNAWLGEGEAWNATFQIIQQWSNISRCLFHMTTCIPCPLLTAVSKFTYLLPMCCNERKHGLYSEAEPIKRRQIWPLFSVDYTTFYRQHLCGGQCTQEQSQPQQYAWNSKLFVIFPAEFTAAQSLHFQHLMWTEVMSSRRL